MTVDQSWKSKLASTVHYFLEFPSRFGSTDTPEGVTINDNVDVFHVRLFRAGTEEVQIPEQLHFKIVWFNE